MSDSPDVPSLEDKPLSPKERAFMAEYFRNGMRMNAAYHVIFPKADAITCRVNSSRLFSRIRTKTTDWERILKLANLDDFTLALEVRKKLRAKKSEFYQGSAVATVQDNGTQMRAVELLADLLGRRKAAVPIGPDGKPIGGVLLVPESATSERAWEESGAGPDKAHT